MIDQPSNAVAPEIKAGAAELNISGATVRLLYAQRQVTVYVIHEHEIQSISRLNTTASVYFAFVLHCNCRNKYLGKPDFLYSADARRSCSILLRRADFYCACAGVLVFGHSLDLATSVNLEIYQAGISFFLAVS
jgi:hypothetical protein